ncbi:hypothetical protein NPIL_131761 [Nephila pilipes]|uniref:Uncharacterized protein n=1 Tax=Nephila pilipes TaxID=299642 RepID=A0A8X6PPX0_NEPPI|nr:hypothetical protein NPIL_131761 [Nephila pilipes]
MKPSTKSQGDRHIVLSPWLDCTAMLSNLSQKLENFFRMTRACMDSVIISATKYRLGGCYCIFAGCCRRDNHVNPDHKHKSKVISA